MVFFISPCQKCGDGRYRTWEPDWAMEHGDMIHYNREVCQVCAKSGPMWWRKMWCWLDDRTQRSRKVLIATGVLACMFAWMLGILVGAVTTR